MSDIKDEEINEGTYLVQILMATFATAMLRLESGTEALKQWISNECQRQGINIDEDQLPDDLRVMAMQAELLDSFTVIMSALGSSLSRIEELDKEFIRGHNDEEQGEEEDREVGDADPS